MTGLMVLKPNSKANNKMKRLSLITSLALTVGTSFYSQNALAGSAEESSSLAYEEVLSRNEANDSVTAETTELLGERIDLNSGSVSFSHTDISLPGNSKLPVTLSRVHKSKEYTNFNRTDFADWALDIPYIQTTTLKGAGEGSIGTAGPWGQSPRRECSGILEEGEVFIAGNPYSSTDYYNGDTIHIPGQISEKLLDKEDSQFRKRTKSNWGVKCEDNDDNTGEIFKVHSPDGTVYTFSRRFNVIDGVVVNNKGGLASVTGENPKDDTVASVTTEEPDSLSVIQYESATRYQLYMFVTLVEDRFGNTVTYDYTTGGLLKSITGSDGRKIELTRFTEQENPGFTKLIKTVTTNNRQWTYNYAYANKVLQSVVLPDGRSWQYNLLPLLNVDKPGISEQNCQTSGDAATFSITHPNGLTGEFDVKRTRHGNANVTWAGNLENWGEHTLKHYTKPCSTPMSIVSKKLTATGMNTLNWTYTYSQNQGFYSDISALPTGGSPSPAQGNTELPTSPIALPSNINTIDYKSTTVTTPDGAKTIYYHNRDFRSALDGSLVATQYFDTNGTKLKTSMTTLEQDNTHIGDTGLSYSNIKPMEYRLNKTKSITKMHYASGAVDEYISEFSDFNTYGVAAKTHEYHKYSGGAATGHRYTNQGFTHDTTAWILNLPTTTAISTTNSAYTTVNETSYYDSSNSAYKLLPYEQKAHGVWQKRFVEYHTNGNKCIADVDPATQEECHGNVSKVEFNANLKNADGTDASINRYVSYASYKRGKPQTVTVPQRYNATATMSASTSVDDNGWLSWTTDFDAAKVNFGYDAMGRRTSINPTDPTVLDTVINYSYIGTAPNDQPIQTISRCTATTQTVNGVVSDVCATSSALLTTKTTLDGLLRSLKTETTDVARGVTVYQNNQYNAYNSPTFQSYAAAVAGNTAGTTTIYDGLQRAKSTSVTGGGSQTTTYLSGNKIKTSDFNTNETTTTYLAYGAPSYDNATTIASPEGVTTSITYNLYGNQTSVTQSGTHKSAAITNTQYMAYDSQQRLCKVKRTDVGQTVFGYTTGGEMAWMAQGTSGGTNTNCTNDALAVNKVSYTYGNGGTKHTASYGDGTPTVTSTLNNNGDLVTLIAGNVTQNYQYNKARSLELETLNVDGKSLTLDYAYNTLGHLASLTYPDAVVGKVNFLPNAFGQATQAIATNGVIYAQAGLYHPTGTLQSFTYGNGLVHTTELNTRNLPKKISDVKGSVIPMSLSYTYDNQSNVTSITDNINSAYSLTALTYDGLDRLTSTTGGSDIGSSALTYDSLGNITQYINKGASLDYTYNTTSNLLTAVSDSVGSVSRDFNNGYDARGNVTNNGKRGFNYNLANQMVQSGSNTYVYDGFNRRVKTIDNGGTKTKYSMYSQSGKLLYRETEDGPISYIFMGGKMVAKDGYNPPAKSGDMHYKPFGESIETAVDAVGYTGHKFDKDLGLSYMQARYYDPVIGRFMSNDPVGYSAENPTMSFNRYLYVNNNPYKYVDPDGEWFVGAIIGAAIEVAVQAYTGELGMNSSSIGKILRATAAGAVGAGIATGVAKINTLANLGKVGQASTRLGGDVLTSMAGTKINGGDITVSGIVADVTISRAATGVGSSVGFNSPSGAADKIASQMKPRGSANSRKHNRKIRRQTNAKLKETYAENAAAGALIGNGVGSKTSSCLQGNC